MQKILDLIEKKLGPIAKAMNTNVFMKTLTESIMNIIPLTLTGTIVTILNIIAEYVPGFPDFSLISTFSFGIAGLVIAFTFTYNMCEKRKMNAKKISAASAAIGLFLFLAFPVVNEAGMLEFNPEHLGSSAIFMGIFVGWFTYMVFKLCSKFSFFRGQSAIPDLVSNAFDSLVPIFLLMLFGWVVIVVLKIDFYAWLLTILSPVTRLGASYWGFLIYWVGGTLFYFLGMSAWTLYGFFYPILISGIAENARLVAAGLPATMINIDEVAASFVTIGGMGCTMMLGFLLLISKSKKLRTIGKISFIPTLMNINEPLVYGVPIVLNPILFIPFILSQFLACTITWVVLSLGWVTIPSSVFSLWFIPMPLIAWFSTQDWRALVLLAFNLFVTFVVWYPFWRVFDKQQAAEEEEAVAKEAKKAKN
jgi:PTS system cellobiose-specific IIC component